MKKNPALFVEGLAYSLNKGIVMEADFTDKPSTSSAKFNDIGLWFQKWFFIHADEMTAGLAEGETAEEIVPLRAYYHRHTRGIFWQMPYIIPFAHMAWFRYLLGWAVPPNIPLLKSTQTPAMKKMWREQFMVQDMLLPMHRLQNTIEYIDTKFSVYPIWLCPHLVVNHSKGGMLRPTAAAATEPHEMFVDIGIYGVPQRQPFEHVSATRGLEALVREYEGYQGLYAVCYMNRAEFRSMFHHELYDACREKYSAVKKFPEVCEKIGVSKSS
jgi:delta24-sterol reductase